MKYFSVCSGIECASVAWHPLGFKPMGFSEIDPFRSAVLDYHYPEVKNYGDFTQIEKDDIGGSPDVLVGGTPCATFSIAGLREGISSERGNLALEFIRMVKRLNPRWVVWENVPGVLSSNNGRDFASFLTGLAECGYGFAYRVLDTQYIRTQRFPRAIPQMRRRVFVVGHSRDWRCPSKVLFDREVLRWNPPPSRPKKQSLTRKTTFRLTRSDQHIQDDKAGTIAARDYKSATDLVSEDLTIIHGNFSRVNGDGFKKDGATYTLTATEVPSIYQGTFEARSADDGAPRVRKEDVASTLTARDYKSQETCVVFEPRSPDDGAPRVKKEEVSPTLNAMTGGNRQPCVSIVFEPKSPDGVPRVRNDFTSPTLNSMTGGNITPCIVDEGVKAPRQSIVRRLTPLECERLQGLPDNYTQVPYRGKPKEECPVSKRYEAVGRGMSINVMEFLGTRIMEVDKDHV